MFYVYILQSLSNTDRMYVGFTNNLKHRLEEHNSGECVHTVKYMPWKLHTFIGFDSKEKALDFERYLKSGSGREFAKRHFLKLFRHAVIK